MAEGSPRELTAITREERTLHELAASRRELVASVTRQVRFNIEQMQLEPDEAFDRARQRLREEPEACEPEHVMWLELSRLIEREPERGQALWQHLKDEAIRELGTGIRASRTLERPINGRPYERAQFAALVLALRDALAPRNMLEELLIQQMASAYDLHLRWQTLAVQRVEEGVWQGERDRRRALEQLSPAQRERYQSDTGWLPPRIAETEALDQTVLTADRYQRSFLRLMKAYRDQRRLVGSLVVAGGQVNIGEQQVNVQGPAPTGPSPVRPAPTRPARASRVRKPSKRSHPSP
jgi:hypothetical protein